MTIFILSLIGERSNDEIVTITAKIWYVSDFDGGLPDEVRNSLDQDTPHIKKT